MQAAAFRVCAEATKSRTGLRIQIRHHQYSLSDSLNSSTLLAAINAEFVVIAEFISALGTEFGLYQPFLPELV